MKPHEGSVTERLAVAPDALFELITTAGRLPEWNEHIHHVVDAPYGPTREVDEWVVEIRALGKRWNSRSRIEKVDPDKCLFAFRSQSDDDNPSFARWRWEVVPVEDGTEVTVSWELHPKTFWRRFLGARIRHHQLKEEVRSSLRVADRALSPDASQTAGGSSRGSSRLRQQDSQAPNDDSGDP